ncbi:glycosyltransferase family 1 protein [Daedalea quercina L-15889]|uniref:Glycosyltransferase family 1 protein n=1 Tax=Daedalea quercina L-15889 TaxID=1314783 RepID=A0A165NT45_9APHY|nr:glycosyltransferase family 1 protein [Daedalea quercina L-15889]
MSGVLGSLTRRRHVVLFVYKSWGQIRPLCDLAANMVKLRTVAITLFTTATFYDRIQNELKRNFGADDMHRMLYIRVIALRHNRSDPLDNRILEDSFSKAFERLAHLQPNACVHTGMEFEPLSAPDGVILDFQGRGPLSEIRRISRKHVKVYVWFAGASSAIFRMYCPERIGGIGDLPSKSEHLARRTGVSVERAAGEVALGNSACLINVPGLPPIYDYEVQPQRLMGPTGQVGDMMLTAYESVPTHGPARCGTLSGCDGIILASPECYEREATATLREWFASTSRSVYACGPLVGQPSSIGSTEKQQPSTAPVEEFLFAIMASHGERSLLYVSTSISFGTVYWPLEPDKLSAFLDIAMAMKIPFILNHASPYLPAEEFIVEKVANYRYGLFTRWCPQQLILSHSATGWFVTHGGHSSVMESIMEGVPMICWPFAFNHSLNAVRVSEELQIGYELLETRNGPGLRRAHRLGKAPQGSLASFISEARDIMRMALGEDGVRKHRNIQRLRREVGQAWSKRGSSRRAVEDLLASLGCGGSLLPSWLC